MSSYTAAHSLEYRAPRSGESDRRTDFPLSRAGRQLGGAKIFGIGTIRTGTTSLGDALTILGFKHTHANRAFLLKQIRASNLAPVFEWADQHQSFEDWPWPLIYRELDQKYPDSRFILTVRADEETWLRSIVKYSEWIGPSRGREMFFGYSMPTGREREYLTRYREHNQAVRAYFSSRPERLMEVSWGGGDEWQRLCAFLGVPIPNQPFPVKNTGMSPIKKNSRV